MENFEWLQKLSELTGREEPCVLITVMEAKGYTPRDAGTKMIVTTGEQFGTIGGGNLEFQAIAEARKLLAESATISATCHYPLGPKLAQCCGGTVTVFLEPFAAKKKTVWLFGAGHVGKEVAKVLEGLPVKIKWIDSREAEFPRIVQDNAERIVTDDPVALTKDIDGNSYVVVMTHSHDTDYNVVSAALKKDDFAYLGVIGSKTKCIRFRKRLEGEGLSTDKLTCPIGISGINGKHPREIAIAVAAELLTLNLTGTAVLQDSSGNVECEGKVCGTCKS